MLAWPLQISSLFGIRQTFTLCFGLNLSEFVIAFLKGGFQYGMCGICMLQFDILDRVCIINDAQVCNEIPSMHVTHTLLRFSVSSLRSF